MIHLKGGNYDIFYNQSSKLLKTLIRSFLRNSDKVIVLGESLVKMYDFLPEISKNIVVVKNALTADIPPETHKERSVITFIYLSNLIFSKGYTHLLTAATSLYEDGVKDFKLIFAGDLMNSPDDPENLFEIQNKFLTEVEDTNKPYVEYVGAVSGEAKAKLLERADVLSLPTNYHVEGQPVCIIEAMAYSCAILTTSYRSIPDIVTSDNCVFVSFGDVKDIKSKMKDLITNQDKLMKMGQMSRDSFMKNFTWQRHFEEMKKVILHK